MCKKLIYTIASALVLGAFTSVSKAELIAYWPLDEGEGTVALDVVGGFDGQINGGNWFTPSKVGDFAYEGAGANEINCGAGPTPTTKDLTFAWWMIDNHDSYGTIMNKSLTDSTAGYNILVRPRNEDSPLRFRIGGWQAYGGWGAECRLPADAYNEGEWVHITCTYDSVTDTASIYVNGELPPNGDFNPKTGNAGIEGVGGYCEGVNNSVEPLYLRGGNEGFNGVMDDVAISDQALTAEEVMSVFTNGPRSFQTMQVFTIKEVEYTPADNQISLTWDSREGEFYVVKYSYDMQNWDSDLDDGIEADLGETTTKKFDLALPGIVSGRVYFRVDKM